MSALKRQGDDDENLERWLLTYADLITLLLALFVVMYSMSQIDSQKFGKVSAALNAVLAGSDGVLKSELPLIPQSNEIRMLSLNELRLLREKISNYVTAQKMEPEIEVILNERDLTLHITESAFYEPGRAEIKPKAKEFLMTLSGMLKDISNHIRVEGHSDNVPINTPQFPSNWELSAIRATNVVRFLVEASGLDPSRVSALGCGEFRPRFQNNPPENRMRNRRTDIVIISL